MKSLSRIALLFASSTMLVITAPAVASAKTVGPSANGSTVTLHKGDTLVINLQPANSGSTGYHWRFATKPKKSVLKLQSNRSAGKQQVLTFKAVGPGSTALKLQYLPPARGAKPVKTFRLRVSVR